MIKTSTISVTRPANTTQYTAGDVMGGLFTFSVAAGSSAFVRGAVFIDSAAEATKPEFDLFLFSAEPTVAADNAAFAPTDAEMLKCVEALVFLASNFKTAGANGVITRTGLDIPYTHVTDRNLYGVMVARNTYTPVSSEVFTLTLGTVSD